MNRPRTPVNYPRMKPRGHRAKHRLAQRNCELHVIPHAIAEPRPDGTGYTFRPTTSGGMRIELRRWTDGYGRRVPNPNRQDTHAPTR